MDKKMENEMETGIIAIWEPKCFGWILPPPSKSI